MWFSLKFDNIPVKVKSKLWIKRRRSVKGSLSCSQNIVFVHIAASSSRLFWGDGAQEREDGRTDAPNPFPRKTVTLAARAQLLDNEWKNCLFFVGFPPWKGFFFLWRLFLCFPVCWFFLTIGEILQSVYVTVRISTRKWCCLSFFPFFKTTPPGPIPPSNAVKVDSTYSSIARSR